MIQYNVNAAVSTPNARLSLLIVEDEMLSAMQLEDLGTKMGFHVVKAARVPEALALAQSTPLDGAILDVNLGGSRVFPVADELRKRDIPFLFVSAYGRHELPVEYRVSGYQQKPVEESKLRAELERLVLVGNRQRAQKAESAA